MHDKRVQKGNTYAAMVIPAGSYPDTITGSNVMDQSQNVQTMKTQTLRTTKKVSNRRFNWLLNREAKTWCDKFKNTPTETSPLLNQFMVVTIMIAKQKSSKNG